METVDIIKQVVDAIDKTFIVKSSIDHADGTYTLITCDTMYLQEKFLLEIDSKDYKIIEIVKDVSIKISGPSLPTVDSFDIYPPIYFHGTVIQTKIDMQIAKRKGGSDSKAILPFIYLKEIIKDQNFRKNSAIAFEKQSDLQLFFLTFSNFKNWQTVDHYEKSIYPMQNLVSRFIEAAQKELLIGDFEKGGDETINHVNFGVYQAKAGHTESIFVDKLSGVELNITFPFYKGPCVTCN